MCHKKLGFGKIFNYNHCYCIYCEKLYSSNGTLRDNVLLGRVYDADRWKSVVEATALASDLQQLTGGEFCEIGEKVIWFCLLRKKKWF